MSGPCYQDLIEKWRNAADDLEDELIRLGKLLPPDRARCFSKKQKEVLIHYVQGNAVISTIRTCANELETEHDQ